MVKCSFCGKEIPKGRGLLFVKKTGEFFYFCSRKCKRSFEMKRNPLRTKWTQRFKEKKGEHA
jgi:large subunit ribosomal protein L24e